MRTKNSAQYLAIKRLWLTKEDRYAEAGEMVDLSYATPEQIAELERVGAIRPALPIKDAEGDATDD